MQQIDHTKNIIELHNISFSYGEEKVLENINLDIHKGDYLGIIGPNGGGKSTLLKIMIGLLEPSSGKVTVFGKDIKKFHERWKIGYVAQKVSHFDTNFPLTVEEVVSMGHFAKKGLFKTLTKEDKDDINEAICQVEMLQFRKRLIGDLSGGQQQRVFIARALAAKPEVIILDEPTVGVDVKAQEQFYALLKKLNQELHLTLVLVSHELDVVAHEATEIACINKDLVYHGAPKEFLEGDYFQKLYGKGVKFILHN
jgi:zinc transport system ATP-binding protein